MKIERALIDAQNGVFILFTPTHGTPQMISDKNGIPLGLIPKERMGSYETTVKPRVHTTHQMPENQINCILIRASLHRPQAEDERKFVDESYYKFLLAKYPQRILEKVINPETFKEYVSQGIPSAFYYYVPKGGTTPVFAAIFGKQINSKILNQLTDPGAFYNRTEDLHIINKMLVSIGLPAVEQLLSTEDLQTINN